MKKILLLLSFISLFAYAQKTGVTHDAKVLRVVDGDTIAIEAKYLPDPLKKELLVRIYGVDTPEKGHRAKCDKESKLGQDASTFTKNTVKKAKKIQVTIIDWDKYGGRILGDIILDGSSLRETLISKGYAREYFGDAKKSWCQL